MACITTDLPVELEGTPMATDDAIRPKSIDRLASVASRAAIELDDIAQGRHIQPVAILRLIDILRSDFAPGGDDRSVRRRWGKASALLVMRRAIDDTDLGSPMVYRDDVLRKTSDILDSLTRVANEPDVVRRSVPDEIDKLQALCIALSKRVSAASMTHEDEPPSKRGA